jgi:hypothetical protein
MRPVSGVPSPVGDGPGPPCRDRGSGGRLLSTRSAGGARTAHWLRGQRVEPSMRLLERDSGDALLLPGVIARGRGGAQRDP